MFFCRHCSEAAPPAGTARNGFIVERHSGRMPLRCASVGACENAGVKPVNMTLPSTPTASPARLNVLIILRYPCRACGSGFCAQQRASIEVKSSKKGRQKNFRSDIIFLFEYYRSRLFAIFMGSRRRVLLIKDFFRTKRMGYGNEADAIAAFKQFGCRSEAQSRATPAVFASP